MSIEWDDERPSRLTVYLLGLVDSHDQPCSCAQCIEAAALLAHAGHASGGGSAPAQQEE